MIDSPPAHSFTALTPDIAWKLGLSLILSQYGQDLVDERGRRTREITCCSVAVLNPDGVMPDARAMPGAPFWGDPRKMQEYVRKEWIRDDNPDNHSYTYGQMLGSQLDDILDDLIACPATRRAVAVLRGIGGERPCLDKLQFLIRDGKLLTVADFRSLDWGGAWPADFAGIRAIQHIICLGLDLAGIHIKPGPIVTQASSCHAYWDELLGWGFGPKA